MERIVLKLGMFETLMVAVIAIYVGEFLRNKIPVLKKYCLPASVVGGTLFALLSLLLYSLNIFELNFDYKTVNQLFYCLFFAASGAAASLALLKKGGKLVYATCSVLPSENHQQVVTFLASEAGKDFTLEAEEVIFAHQSGYDGFYMARLINNG